MQEGAGAGSSKRRKGVKRGGTEKGAGEEKRGLESFCAAHQRAPPPTRDRSSYRAWPLAEGSWVSLTGNKRGGGEKEGVRLQLTLSCLPRGVEVETAQVHGSHHSNNQSKFIL